MMRSRLSILFMGLAALTACGGSTTGEASFDVNRQVGREFNSTSTGQDARFVSLSEAAPGQAVLGTTTQEDPTRSQDTFTAYMTEDDQSILFHAETALVSAQAFATVDTNASRAENGARADLVGGSLPTSGRATYTGDYVGFLTQTNTSREPNLTQSYIVGRVEIVARFDNPEQANGTITGRQRFLTSNGASAGTMEDVGLAPLQLNSTTGPTTGGGIDDATRYIHERSGPLFGDWTIAFGGDGAQEAAGTVQIQHDYINNTDPTDDDYIETGVFAVGRVDD